MNNSYQKERTKLTLLYFGIILLIVGVFSYIVVFTQNQQYRKFDNFNENIKKIPVRPGDPFDALYREDVKRVETIVKAIKREHIKSILLLDVPLLLFASLLSYYLSGRTLEPILYTLEKQKRFISDASHELKTPLTNIKIEAEVLERSKNTTLEEYKEFAQNVINDVNRLDDLVKQLLYIDKSENKASKIDKTRIDLVALTKEVADEFKSVAGLKNIEIDVESKRKKVAIYTDKSLLHRLLSILIDNAIKYNKKDGRIDIRIVRKSSKSVILEVTDTGIGINKKDLSKIFDRFYRASEDRNEKGYGLGLSIADQLAKELGIEIGVESKIGKGSTFKLTICQ